MLMTIRYQNGLRTEAVLLATNRDRMRVAVDSERDTVELYMLETRWFTEEGAEIEIEVLIPLAATELLSKDPFPPGVAQALAAMVTPESVPLTVFPKITQESWAGMIGTTRARVN
jgi:hypothetical protein